MPFKLALLPSQEPFKVSVFCSHCLSRWKISNKILMGSQSTDTYLYIITYHDHIMRGVKDMATEFTIYIYIYTFIKGNYAMYMKAPESRETFRSFGHWWHGHSCDVQRHLIQLLSSTTIKCMYFCKLGISYKLQWNCFFHFCTSLSITHKLKWEQKYL